MTDNLPAVTDEWCIKEFGWTKSQFEVVHRTYFKGMTMDDITIFGHVCKHTGLDPFLKQIYPVMRQGKVVIQTAIDGYRTIAERTKRYSPGREPSFTYDKNGEPFSATAYVKKMTEDGTWHEVAATAYFKEYNPGIGPFWKKMPHTMIAKCAEALALRKAFPQQLSAVLTKEEMDQAGPADLPLAESEDITPPLEENLPLIESNKPCATNHRKTEELPKPNDLVDKPVISAVQAHEMELILIQLSKEVRSNVYLHYKIPNIHMLPMEHYEPCIKRLHQLLALKQQNEANQ